MKRLNLIFILLAIAFTAQAQIYIDNQGNVYDQSKPKQQNHQVRKQPTKSNTGFDRRNLEFGGSLGLQFGNYTSVSISPQVGYRFSKYLSAGAGIGYSYFKDDWRGINGKYEVKQHFASFNLYADFFPIDFIVLSVKPEISRMWETIEYDHIKDTYTKFVPSVIVGGGVKFGPMMAQIKYDVVQNDYSPYGNTIFYSIGYTFGF